MKPIKKSTELGALKHLIKNGENEFYEPDSWLSLKVLQKITGLRDPVVMGFWYAHEIDQEIEAKLKNIT